MQSHPISFIKSLWIPIEQLCAWIGCISQQLSESHLHHQGPFEQLFHYMFIKYLNFTFFLLSRHFYSTKGESAIKFRCVVCATVYQVSSVSLCTYLFLILNFLYLEHKFFNLNGWYAKLHRKHDSFELLWWKLRSRMKLNDKKIYYFQTSVFIVKISLVAVFFLENLQF